MKVAYGSGFDESWDIRKEAYVRGGWVEDGALGRSYDSRIGLRYPEDHELGCWKLKLYLLHLLFLVEKLWR